VIRTGKSSSCIVKFSSLGALRMTEDTTATVDSFKTDNRPSSVLVGLDVGTVVCKVKKLSAKDSFEVKTKLAVCGVRGTQFMVEALPDGRTMNVAVAEGSVSILPHNFDTVNLRMKASAAATALLSTAATLRSLSPVVAEGQEASIDVEAMAKVNEAYDKLVKASSAKPDGGASAGTIKSKKDDARSVVVSDLARSVVSKLDEVPLAAKGLSASSKERLEGIKDVKLEVPPEQAGQKAGEGDVIDASAAPGVVATRSVEIETDPADAPISLDGAYVSSGHYEAELLRDRSYSVVAAKDGYKSATRTLEPGTGDERIKMTLQPVEVSFIVKSDPPDAMLFVDGKLAGSTPCRVGGAYGQSLPLKLTRTGYQEFQTEIMLQSTTPDAISLTMSPVPVTLKFKAVPDNTSLSAGGKALGVGSCSVTRISGATVDVEALAPGYAKESRSYSFGSTDAAIEISLHTLKEIDATKLSSSPLCALAWYAGSILYADGSGAIGAVRIGQGLKIEPAWRLATKNVTMSVDQLRVRDGKLTLAGSAEWLSIQPGTGEIVEREPVSGEFASLSGRSGAFLDSIELRPKTNGLSIRRGGPPIDLNFPAGSLMFPVVYGNRVLIADAMGTVYFIDPQNAVIESSVPTKAGQPYETGFLVDGNRGYFAGRSGNVVCIDLDKRSIVWQRKIEAATFLDDVQDAGGLVGLYSKGRFYFLSKSSGDLSPVVIGNLAARPCVDGSRAYAPTSSGEIVEYSLPSGERKRTLSVGGSISSVAMLPGPLAVLAIGMNDGTLMLYNPEGER
jgi:outer membrane protein assembly factor BamB